jgi:serine/threonine protein kinase
METRATPHSHFCLAGKPSKHAFVLSFFIPTIIKLKNQMFINLTSLPELLRFNKAEALYDCTIEDFSEKARSRSLQRFDVLNEESNLTSPRFRPKEVITGAKLGEGSFGIIYEAPELQRTLDCSLDGVSDKRKKYAVKMLRPETFKMKDKARMLQAIVNFESERRILTTLKHPSILQVYRNLSCDRTFRQQTIIIMERLYETLETRLERLKGKYLQELYLAGMGVFEDVDIQIDQKRLRIASDIASAMSYLHKKRCIHRDLKSSNIAFDENDNAKLFDFGLARELPPKININVADETYKLTAMIGSPRYMSPEVANQLRYNEKCDVYSFAILTWEIMSLQKPFKEFSTTSMHGEVWGHSGPQTRPRLHEATWPISIRNLMKLSWSPEPLERPTMHVISLMLDVERACKIFKAVDM